MSKQKYNHSVRTADTMKIERLIIIVAIASVLIGVPAGAALKQRAANIQKDMQVKSQLQSDIDRVQKQLDAKARELDAKAEDVQKLEQQKKDLEQQLQSKAKSKSIISVARAAEAQAVTPPVAVSGDLSGLLTKYFGSAAGQAQLIMSCESGGVPTKHNYNPATGDDSWGLFQINRYGSLAAGRPSADWLVVAENNIQYAANMHARSGWSPWANCARKNGLI